MFINYLVDFLFGVDIIINFFSAYEVQEKAFNGIRGVERTEIRLKKIFRNYVTGWFFLDLLATFPT